MLNAATAHGFAYTVGLWPTRRDPEFVLTGTDVTDPKQAHDLVSGAVYRVIDDGAEFTAGDEDDRVLEHHPVRFGAVADTYAARLVLSRLGLAGCRRWGSCSTTSAPTTTR